MILQSESLSLWVSRSLGLWVFWESIPNQLNPTLSHFLGTCRTPKEDQDDKDDKVKEDKDDKNDNGDKDDKVKETRMARMTRMTKSKKTRMMTLTGSSQGDPVVESGQIASLSVHRKGFHRKDLISAK